MNNHGLVCYIADYVIVGTGGPGDLFKDSVYPETQITSLGMLLRAGAVARNLTEMQFGIAAQQPRWNLSGSYQQAIPRYYSTDIDGNDEREFLNDYFPSLESLTYATFLKGYQWPFDVKKINNYGSSCIDLLVIMKSMFSIDEFLLIIVLIPAIIPIRSHWKAFILRHSITFKTQMHFLCYHISDYSK